MRRACRRRLVRWHAPPAPRRIRAPTPRSDGRVVSCCCCWRRRSRSPRNPGPCRAPCRQLGRSAAERRGHRRGHRPSRRHRRDGGYEVKRRACGHPHGAGAADRLPGGRSRRDGGGRRRVRRTSPSPRAPSSSRRSTWSSARARATRRPRSWRCRWTSSRRSSCAQQGSTETSIILQSVVAVDQLPPPERHRRRRHRPAVHAPRPEPRPHPGAAERLAAAPDGAGQQLHVRHGCGLERRGPQRDPVERARPRSRSCATARRPSTGPTPSPAS